jgi:hypothetical protein
MCWTLDLLLNGSTHFSESILNVFCHICREHRAVIQRFGYRLLPRPQQAFHSLARALIHD